jgi:hypothetical protein
MDFSEVEAIKLQGAARSLTKPDLRSPLIKLLQPLPAEVDVKDFVSGLGSLGMALAAGATALSRSQRSRAAQVLAHQGESSTGDQREEDQVDSSQKVVQGGKVLSVSLV